MTGHALVFGLCVAGFCGIAFAVERQQEAVVGRVLAPAPTRLLRFAGWVCLALAFVAAVRLQGWGFGSVAWVGHLSGAAGCVFCAMVLQARRRARRRDIGARRF